MKYLIILLAFTSLSIGCKEKSGLEKEVMAIHDEVMPKLGELNKLKRNLSKQLPDIQNEPLRSEVLQIITDLENADEGMMTWMSEYKIPSDESSKTEYLTKEKESIQKVRKDMLSSIAKAKSLTAKVVGTDY